MENNETPVEPRQETRISVDGLLDHTKRLYEAQKLAVKIPNQGEAIYQRGYFKALFDIMAFIEAYVEAQKQLPKVAL